MSESHPNVLFVVQVLVVIGLVILVALALQVSIRRRAASRHFLWLTTLLVVCASPLTVAACWVGGFSLHLPFAEFVFTESNDRASLVTTDQPAAARAGQMSEGPPMLVPGLIPGAELDEARAGNSSDRAAGTSVLNWDFVLASLAVIWMVGVGIGISRLTFGLFQVQLSRRSMNPLDEKSLSSVLESVKRAVGMEQIEIGYSSSVASPIVIGVMRPVIVLPPRITENLKPEQLACVLAHEAAHIARRDPWVNLLQRLVGVVLWPHPLVAIMNRCLTRAREEVCDNYALAVTFPRDYAETLLKVSLSSKKNTAFAISVPMVYSKTGLEKRIAALLDQRRPLERHTPRRIRLIVSAIMLTTAMVVSLLAMGNVAEAQQEPSASGEAADLVRQIIAEEKALLGVKSLYVRMQSKWTRRPGLRTSFDNAYQKNDSSDRKPSISEVNELAFDDHRLRQFSDKKDVAYDLRIWDGSRAVVHERYLEDNQEHYAFDGSPSRFIGDHFLSGLSWLRVGTHSHWWRPQRKSLGDAINGRPEDYAITSQEQFRGYDCSVLTNPYAHRRLFISDDGHLRGLEIRYVPSDVDSLSLYRKFSGMAVDDTSIGWKEWRKWSEGISDAERAKIKRKVDVAVFPSTRILVTHFVDDYKELAPGIWWPMKQGYWFPTKEDDSVVATLREQTTVDIQINKRLDDALFEMELKEGVRVNDWGHDPPLFYDYKKDRTEAEWKAIVEEHEREESAKRD